MLDDYLNHTVFEAFNHGKSFFDLSKPINSDVILYNKEYLQKAFREGWRFQEKQKNPPAPLQVEPTFESLKERYEYGRDGGERDRDPNL